MTSELQLFSFSCFRPSLLFFVEVSLSLDDPSTKKHVLNSEVERVIVIRKLEKQKRKEKLDY